jgi:hypothetical protein
VVLGEEEGEGLVLGEAVGDGLGAGEGEGEGDGECKNCGLIRKKTKKE